MLKKEPSCFGVLFNVILLMALLLYLMVSTINFVFFSHPKGPTVEDLSSASTQGMSEGKSGQELIDSELIRHQKKSRAIFLEDTLGEQEHDFTILKAPKGHSLLRLVVWGGQKPHVGDHTVYLRGEYEQFHFFISPKSAMHGHHSLTFEILGDNRLLYRQVVSLAMPEMEKVLDVRGVQELEIRAYTENHSSSSNPGVVLRDAYFD